MTTEQRQRSGRRERREMPPVDEREWEQVLWEVSDAGVLAITLNRPERRNAVTFRLLRELIQLIDHAAATPEIRAVSIRGAGTLAFSSGDDMGGMDPDPLYDSGFTVHHELVRKISLARG